MTARYDRDITDLQRRLSNSVIVGSISKVDHKQGRYRVKAGALESDWLPMATPRAGKTSVYSSYEEGEQVIIASPSGDLSQAVILGAIATERTQAGDKGNTHVTKYPDGSVIAYDHDTHSYSMQIAEGGGFALSIGGGVSLVATGGKLIINAPGGIETVSPTLTHNETEIGDTHRHGGVERGGEITDEPV